MLVTLFILAASAAACALPSLDVPACPLTGTIRYNKSVPDKQEFPLTQVDLCYTDTSIDITFTAYNETNFYFNESQKTNDPIWQYEVMEAFIARATDDPQTYLEFEVNPNNVTFQAFIYNPSKVRATPLGTYYIPEPFPLATVVDKPAEKWTSTASIPLGLFNVEKAKGTDWRMNFFRTVVSPDTFPDQLLGAWSPPNEPSFHMTPFFGRVHFI